MGGAPLGVLPLLKSLALAKQHLLLEPETAVAETWQCSEET
jgi:hypothetical protein